VNKSAARALCGEQGYNLIALVMIIAVMNILVAAALPLWSQAIRRDKEEELIFRGLQYAEAIRVFHNRFQRWPTRLEELIEVKPRCIRQLWKDPMTEDGKWQLIFEGREQQALTPPPLTDSNGRPRPTGVAPINPGVAGLDQQGHSFGPIKGVYSRSTKKSILLWAGRDEYDQWRFNVDLLTGARPQGVGLPQGAGAQALSVRWLGRPMRQLGGLAPNPGVGNPGIGLPPGAVPGRPGLGTPGGPGGSRRPGPPTPNRPR
jgi:type II secretory pathway pseudopilin PulG